MIFLDHARAQMGEREIQDSDVMKCLKSGVLEGEDWNAEHQDTAYRMAAFQGRDKLVVIVGRDAEHDLVVTAFRKERT